MNWADFRLSWTEGIADEEGAVRSRSLALDLSQLPPGAYTIQLRASTGGRDPVVRTRDVELYD